MKYFYLNLIVFTFLLSGCSTTKNLVLEEGIYKSKNGSELVLSKGQYRLRCISNMPGFQKSSFSDGDYSVNSQNNLIILNSRRKIDRFGKGTIGMKVVEQNGKSDSIKINLKGFNWLPLNEPKMSLNVKLNIDGNEVAQWELNDFIHSEFEVATKNVLDIGSYIVIRIDLALNCSDCVADGTFNWVGYNYFSEMDPKTTFNIELLEDKYVFGYVYLNEDYVFVSGDGLKFNGVLYEKVMN